MTDKNYKQDAGNGEDPRQEAVEAVEGTEQAEIETLKEAGARVLALDARRTLLIDRRLFLARAEAGGIAVWGLEPRAPEHTEGKADA